MFCSHPSLVWGERGGGLPSTAINREIHDVDKKKKMVPPITREITFGQHVRELVHGVNISNLDLGVQVDSVKQPIKSNSVVSGHVITLRPLMIILITASLSSKMYNCALH